MMNAVRTCQSLTHERNQAISSLREMILRGWLAQTASEPPNSLSVPQFHPQVSSTDVLVAWNIILANRFPFESARLSRAFAARIHYARARHFPRHPSPGHKAGKTTHFAFEFTLKDPTVPRLPPQNISDSFQYPKRGDGTR